MDILFHHHGGVLKRMGISDRFGYQWIRYCNIWFMLRESGNTLFYSPTGSFGHSIPFTALDFWSSDPRIRVVKAAEAQAEAATWPWQRWWGWGWWWWGWGWGRVYHFPNLCSFMFFCPILSSLVEFVVFLSLGLLLISLHNRGYVLLTRKKTNLHCQHKFEYHKSSFLQVGSPLFSDSCQLYANIISSILLWRSFCSHCFTKAELQGDGLARQRSAIIDGLRTAVLERNLGGNWPWLGEW